jgi:uncharacterized protein YecE (DUF72 family)
MSAERSKAGRPQAKGAIRIGTSGFSYREWIGAFYPEGTQPADMLHYYASRLDTVEVNNTFYRLPSPEIVEGWRKSAGPGFHFAVKANQRITHRRDLGRTDDFFSLFLDRIALFKERLGPVLFQFPPYFGDLGTALDFVRQVQAATPRQVRVPVIEVRNPKLLQPEFFTPAVAAGVNLCFNDEFLEPAKWPEPGPVAYLRLRSETYTARELKGFAGRLKDWSAQGRDSYVFFQHEGRATELALALKKLI